MSRNKLAALVLCMLVPALALMPCCRADDLIDESLRVPEAANYNTYVIENGDCTKEVSASGYQVYVFQQNLNIGKGTAHIKQMRLVRNGAVKAGDVLVTFERDGSRAELERQKLALQRAQESLERGLKQRREEITSLTNEAQRASDADSAQLLRLRAQLKQVELERYEANALYSIDEQQRAITELEEFYADDKIIAPFDGVITYMSSKSPGDSVTAGETLVTLQSHARYVIGLDNSNSNFRYGMRVTVGLGPRNNRTEFAGRIIAAANILPDEATINYALVELEGQPELTDKQLRTISVRGDAIFLKNVPIIVRRATRLDGGKTYVSILNGDTVEKRIVVLGHNTSSVTWVALGLEAGQVIIID